MEDTRRVELLLELVVHSFVTGIPDASLQVPHQASVSFVKREIMRKCEVTAHAGLPWLVSGPGIRAAQGQPPPCCHALLGIEQPFYDMTLPGRA